MFYSKSKNGFYPSALRADYDAAKSWTDDAVEITDEQHAALMAAQARGESIRADDTGHPVLAAPAPVPFEALRSAELAQFRTQREQFLNRLAGIGLAAQAAGKTDVLTSALTVRQGLLDLPKDAGVLGATDLQKLKAAIDACIQKLAKAAKPEVANIFKGA